MREADAARRALAARMLSGGGLAPRDPNPIPPRPASARVPLTTEQRQLWLHAEMAPTMPLYNESITIHRLGRYEHRALECALTEILRRHAIWRTAFVEVEGELVQDIAAPFPVTLPIIDLTDIADSATREEEAIRLATEDARAPIPLDRAPLFRARVVRMGKEEHRLYLTLHHIIFDGVSIYRTLVPELAALVDAFERDAPSPLPEPTLDYADYAVWQTREDAARDVEGQVAYWRAVLTEPIPRLELPGDRPRPALPTHAGSMAVFELPDLLIDQLKAIARAAGATLYMVLLAAYKTMLFRWTGDTDIIVGGVTDTRRRPELQPLMGYFLNTMALRSRPCGAKRFRAYLNEVRDTVIGALGATDVPFDRLVRALDIKRGAGTHPLFNTLFSIEPPVAPFPPGWDLTQMDVVVGAAKYDLYLELDERPEGGMAGRFLYSSELFNAATIARMIDHWTRLLQGIAADPDETLADLPMLGADEQAALARWNDTTAPLPFTTIVEAIEHQVAARPNAVAIRFGASVWTYAELDRRAHAIAAALMARDVAPGALIGLCVARSPWMIAAMLGIVRAGAAYLPLDPGYPPRRLHQIVTSAQPALILVDDGSTDSLPGHICPLIDLPLGEAPAPPARAPIDSAAPAYVLYTSGSTGEPKGVVIDHAALANFLAAMAREPGFTADDSILAITTLSFDIAGLEIWLPLTHGGTVILASRDEAVDMAALARLIDQARPSIVQATPATWRGLIERGWHGAPTLKALAGGEALPRALADLMLPRVGELWNMYGPTETTIWSTLARVASDGPIVIGRPIANTQVRILDADGNIRPIGAVGELCIGGAGLARGYRGRDDLTAARFVMHDGVRLYHTGDLGRWRPDGQLECLGRVDHEEKIRGFRVAIEEVEGALLALPGITASAVRAWPDASGERALAGYVVGATPPADWRDRLMELLPDYMVPARLIHLDQLPTTPNGKVDRAALPEQGATVARAFEPPATPTEQKLATIWCAVLRIDQVGRGDEFFELGGHSLLVARLLRRIEADFGTRLPMAALFRAPRLADMAAVIASGLPIETPALIPIQPAGDRPPLIWLDGGSTFIPLADRLGLDQPFLGLSVDVVLEAAGGCPARLETAADLVIEALRAMQPTGPYRLGGWCTSGILTYAVAAQLRQRGEEVALLCLADAFHPGSSRTIGATRYFFSKLRFHVDQSLRQPRGERARYFVQRLRGLSDAAALAGGREAMMQPALRTALDRAALAYTPPPLDVPTLLFQPAEHPDVLDFEADWRASVTGRFDAHVIGGGHRSMLEPPHVDAIAAILAPRLAALADAGRMQARRA